MPRTAWIVASVVLAWAAAVAPARAFTECPDVDRVYHAGVDEGALRAGMLCLVNGERVSRGLDPLAADVALDLAAERHAADMAAREYVGHLAPVPAPFGVTPRDRAAGAGYPGPLGAARVWDVGETVDQTWLENLPADPALMSARAAMKRWMGSEIHCAAILTPEFEHLGVGMFQSVAGGRVTAFWTLLLGGFGLKRTPYAGCPFAALVPLGSAPASPVGAAVGETGLWLASPKAALTRGARVARLVLACSRPAGCRGTATLRARGGKVLGRAAVTVADGATKTVLVRIRAASRRALARRVTRATLRLDAGGAHGTLPISLRPR